MACDLTAGRLVACKDVIGGIKKVWFVDTYCDNIRGSATIANDVMSAGGFSSWTTVGNTTASKVQLFEFDLRPELSNVEFTANADAATGTTFYEQVLTMVLQKRTAASSYQLRLLAHNRCQCFVLDNEDNVYLLGMDHGLNAVPNGSTGTAFGDMAGYTVTVTGREREESIWLTATAGPGTAVYPFDGLSDEADLEITVGTEPT